jgi:phosphoglycerate-specific signal transduction histidine kinase
MDRESDFLSDVFKIALGIVLGGIILWICSESYARYRINQAVTAFAQAAAEISNGMDDAQRRARERQEAERRTRQERARLEQMRRSAAVREAADRERARQRAEAAKEAAWAAFYQPSEECLKQASVECGNAHIRARREFERKYGAGEL